MAGTLEQKIEAYDRHHVLDNRLTAEWYPRRIVAMANTGSMLELGVRRQGFSDCRQPDLREAFSSSGSWSCGLGLVV